MGKGKHEFYNAKEQCMPKEIFFMHISSLHFISLQKPGLYPNNKHYMNKHILPVFIIVIVGLFTLPSCKHEPDLNPMPAFQPDSSWWNVDTQRFVTYSNFVAGAQNHTVLSGASSSNNQYSITFNLPYIPAQGNYLLDCSNTSASAACMEITYNGMRYRAGLSPAAYLHADSANNRAIIKLNATWFYNTINPNDSVAVLGAFHQPE